jgi:hypothetical protein
MGFKFRTTGSPCELSGIAIHTANIRGRKKIIIIIIIKEQKNKRANAGTRNRGTINNKDRIAATMYPLGTWFVSGMCMDTLHKGDNDNDDDDDNNNNNYYYYI